MLFGDVVGMISMMLLLCLSVSLLGLEGQCVCDHEHGL